MKKSTVRYWISLLLIVVFANGSTLPYFAKMQNEKRRFSLEKEKAEGENREKESSLEISYKEYLPHFHFMRQNKDWMADAILLYPELNVAFISSVYLPVLTPPPDQV